MTGAFVPRPSNVPGIPYVLVGRPINVPDKTGIPYVLVGRPVNVPDKTGIPYVLVGRVFNPTIGIGR